MNSLQHGCNGRPSVTLNVRTLHAVMAIVQCYLKAVVCGHTLN